MFLAWCLIAAGRAWYLAGPAREHYLALGEAMASSEGNIPAVRGRILDRNGVPLAWNEKHFDLYYIPEGSGRIAVSRWEALCEVVPDLGRPPEPGGSGRTLLRRNLTVEQLLKLEFIVKGNPSLRIVPRLERVTVSSPEIRALIGRVEAAGAELNGVSGLELEFDGPLRGTPGRYRVMLDRARNWVESSWKLEAEPVPGEEIRLSRSAEELERGEEAR